MLNLSDLKPGDVVLFAQPVERYPFAFVPAGTFGVVRHVDGHLITVAPAMPVPGLAEWDGCVEWYGPDAEANDITGIGDIPRVLRRVQVDTLAPVEIA